MNIVGIDIGGTFTDLVGCIDGRIVTSKASTVPADPTQGVADTIELAHIDMAQLAEVLHGSTVTINTVLERKGARTALITTKGFRDVYAIGRGNRIEAFNLFFHRPRPLVERDLTFEVAERINARGEVLIALNAYVGPRVQSYLRKLETYLRAERFGGRIQIMRSNGGVMSIGLAQEQPVSMMESGPVAGMIGAGRLAADLSLERCIGFDMG